ncbi:hypothetical protein RFI_30597 [Reticulomyxa filosa]|uniref:G-protein coupled receptors family 3 profile domain-containing protein n=1 Tax=Reticulomyxa filosa TaxID=46433 RepID=X6M073_RETFI|nr:hypothetical protein RFI_30597 [Reticulomyxa filosa]|eukprot:ETO06797.1 hypothetical protein RFI_30597 [Reticulomyxa filosa]
MAFMCKKIRAARKLLVFLIRVAMSVNPSLVCSSPYADDCSCSLANLTLTNSTFTRCFVEYVCAYNATTNQFCSGHGSCLFNESRCDCDSNYGLVDCSAQYETKEIASLIRYPLLVFGILFMVISLGLIQWVWKYRRTSEVKAMSITFTNLMLLGCALVSAGVVIIGSGYNFTNCILVEWFTFVGSTLVVACAGVKAFRIASVFNRKVMSGEDLTDKTLLKYLFGTNMVTVILLIIYTILNFTDGFLFCGFVGCGMVKIIVCLIALRNTLHRGAYFRKLNSNSLPLLKEHRCSHATYTSITYYVMVAYVFILLVAVLKYGNETQSVSNIFKETKCIYLGSNIGTVIIIAFGVVILFTKNYSAQIAVRGFGTLIVTVVVIILLFGCAIFIRFLYFIYLYMNIYIYLYGLYVCIRRESLNCFFFRNGYNRPKMRAVYNVSVLDKDGLTVEEKQMSTQYSTNIREKNSKEVMLVMNTLVAEMTWRLEHKIMSIELTTKNLETLMNLSQELTQLIETNAKGNKNNTKKDTNNNSSTNNANANTNNNNNNANNSGSNSPLQPMPSRSDITKEKSENDAGNETEMEMQTQL